MKASDTYLVNLAQLIMEFPIAGWVSHSCNCGPTAQRRTITEMGLLIDRLFAGPNNYIAKSRFSVSADRNSYKGWANSKNLQNAFASRICPGVRHSGPNSGGFATRIDAHRAREMATLSRLRLYKNSMPRGASSVKDVAIE